MIWVVTGLVTAAAIAGLSMPWWWTAFRERAALKRRTANVSAYRTRLRELEADVAAAILPADAIATAKEELEARLLQDAGAPVPEAPRAAPSRALLLVAIVALVLFGGIGYFVQGSWRTQKLIDLSRSDPELARSEALDAMIAELRDRIAAHPDDADSWAWLARSYGQRGSYAESAKAYARANEIKGGQDPDLLVQEGEATAYAQNRSMEGVPMQRFQQALALAPEHPHALWYAGIASLQAGDDRAAIGYWERLVKQPLPSDMKTSVQHALAQLRERNGIKAPTEEAAPASALVLNVDVSVAPALASKVPAGAALFVFAQDPSGPPMPLAVQRLSASQLPAKVSLDDSMSPMPTRKLSSVERWRIVARISSSGSAVPQPGDLEGFQELGKADAGKPVRIVIDHAH